MTYAIEGVWPAPAAAVRHEVVEFWLAESALPSRAAAEQRAGQLVVVARDGRQRIAGVSTAIPVHVASLGLECLYYRTFIGRAHRTVGLRSTGLVSRILRESYRLLNDRYQSGCNQHICGLYLEIENPSIMKVRNDAVWGEDGMNVVYIGRTPGGHHLRVWYFAGARVPR